MKKCYIAGKIGNLPEEVYKANFKRAEAEVCALFFEPVNPVELPHNHGKTWLEYMREDLTEMLKCDCVYAQKNWLRSKGARIEVFLALFLGIKVIFE